MPMPSSAPLRRPRLPPPTTTTMRATANPNPDRASRSAAADPIAAERSDAPPPLLPPRETLAHQWGLLLNGNRGQRTLEEEDAEAKGQAAAEGEHGSSIFNVLPTRATGLSQPHLPGRKRSTSAKRTPHTDAPTLCGSA